MPGRSYELAFVLYVDADRVNTRRAVVILDGVKGALSSTVDEHFFRAMMNEDEAQFYAGLHADRVAFQMRRGRRSQAMAEQLGEAIE